MKFFAQKLTLDRIPLDIVGFDIGGVLFNQLAQLKNIYKIY